MTSGTVAVTGTRSSNAAILTMQVTNINPSNPMDNFHLMMPGYGNGTTAEPMYTPAFIQSLKPFSDIRFMNWEETNDSTLSNWQDRVQPGHLPHRQTGGVPYEDMIELCNETQKDMWINIPAEATPQFVQSLAQLIAADLDPNLNVYVEYGNEDWNSSFSAYGQIAAAARPTRSSNQSLGQYQLVAQQSRLLAGDRRPGLRRRPSARAARGCGRSWAARPRGRQFQQYGLAFIQQEFGPPSQYIYATAVAPYFGDAGTDHLQPTLTTLFADMEQRPQQRQSSPTIKADAAVAEQYGVPLVAYEGGQSLDASTCSGPNFNLMTRHRTTRGCTSSIPQYDARTGSRPAGGSSTPTSSPRTPPWTACGGCCTNVNQAGSQKYDAPDRPRCSRRATPTLDGSVDYADFQTVQANYGQGTMTYWVQGDFNDDGTVNWVDLNILQAEPRSRPASRSPSSPSRPSSASRPPSTPRPRWSTTATG